MCNKVNMISDNLEFFPYYNGYFDLIYSSDTQYKILFDHEHFYTFKFNDYFEWNYQDTFEFKNYLLSIVPLKCKRRNGEIKQKSEKFLINATKSFKTSITFNFIISLFFFFSI